MPYEPRSIQFLSVDEAETFHRRLIVVEAEAAHAFLIDLLGRGECTFQNLLPWIRMSIKRLPA